MVRLTSPKVNLFLIPLFISGVNIYPKNRNFALANFVNSETLPCTKIVKIYILMKKVSNISAPVRNILGPHIPNILNFHFILNESEYRNEKV